MKELVSKQLVRYLEERGVTHIFGLCGHTNIAVLTEIGKSTIRFVNSRHEQVAAHAADGYARVKKEASVVLSPSGPGPHQCRDRRRHRGAGFHSHGGDRRATFPPIIYGKHPHQEINLHADADQFDIYRPFVKRAWRVERADLFPEIIDKAFHLAESGRPGPVLVSVPMDIFSAEIDTAFFDRIKPNARSYAKPALDEAVAEKIVAVLLAAKKPVIYAGGGIMLADAAAELAQLVDRLGIPVAHSLMGKGVLARRSSLHCWA